MNRKKRIERIIDDINGDLNKVLSFADISDHEDVCECIYLAMWRIETLENVILNGLEWDNEQKKAY